MPDLSAPYRLLQAGEPSSALAALQALDLTGLPPADLARVHSWRGQALRDLGRPEEGAAEVIQAIRIMKATGDQDAVLALRSLHADISRSVVGARLAREEEARALSRPILPGDLTALLGRASALLDTGDPAHAPEVARLLDQAEANAVEARDQVLVLLLRGRHRGHPSPIHAAHVIADGTGDQGLIAAVARTAKLLGVTLRRPGFG